MVASPHKNEDTKFWDGSGEIQNEYYLDLLKSFVWLKNRREFCVLSNISSFISNMQNTRY